MKSYNLIFICAFFVLISNVYAQWKPLTGPINGSITCIAMQKTERSSTIIYIGSNIGGLYISKDGGKDWDSTDISNKWITDIKTYKTAVYVGTKNNGVFRSNNEGKSWEQINNGLAAQNIYALSCSDSKVFVAANYTSDGINYIGGLYFYDVNNNIWEHVNEIPAPVTDIANYDNKMIAVSSGNIYNSYDFGDFWKLVNTHFQYKYLCRMAMNETKIFIGTESGLYSSSDNGISWYPSFRFPIVHIAVDQDTVFTIPSGEELLSSIDNGKTWERSGLNEDYLEVISKVDKYTFAGSRLGDIFFSSNLGKSWNVLSSSLQYRYVNSLIFSDSQAYCGTNDNSFFYSTNGGLNWLQAGLGIIKFPVNAIFKDHSNIYIGTGGMSGGKYSYPDGKIYLFTDDGQNLTQLSLNNEYITSLFADNGKIYAGTFEGNICFSHDNGLTWVKYSISNLYNQSFLKLNDKIYVGGSSGLFQLFDNGFKWSKISSVSVNCLSEDRGLIYVGNNNGIYKSTDNGVTFSQISNVSTNSIAFHYGNIYVCGKNGLFVSQNNGETWSQISTNGKKLSKILVKDDDLIGICYSGTMGIYSISLSNLIASVNNDRYNNLPSNFNLDQNYPNPFNPKTTIKYEIPKSTFVSIKVYNIAGQLVDILVNSYRTPGTYTVEWNASKMSSGIYFYKMQTANFVKTKKLILLR